jgi:hypothetical protein
MFGFGRGQKRNALVKEMVETRLRLRGQDEVQNRLFIKSLGTFAAMSLPEATIAAIIEAAVTSCRIPDDCIDPRRLALFAGRAFFRDLITTLKARHFGEFRP